MELRHLRYFIAVAEELHFSRAAARLHVAQPPLSTQIKQLEEEMGVALFLRTKRRVELTEAGSAFLIEARRVLGILDRGVALAREIGTGQRGTLRLGSVYSAIYAVVPQMLRAFAAQHPDISVELSEMTVQQQLDALASGAIDVGILRSPIHDPSIETHLLFREGIVALVPTGHALAARGAIHVADLAPYPFLLSGIGLHSSFRQHVLSLFDRLGIMPNIAREIGEIHSIISLVGAGLGVALAPATVSHIRVSDVTYLPILDDMPQIEVSLAWHRDVRPPALSALLAMVQDPGLWRRDTMPDGIDTSHISEPAG
ncbi:LysR substrate-binding domain-containing protein [Sphingobium sp. HBC34]|uniref:LysR substrate-binding domain-containing protein n=1 Tax=Sphingobium cyanobacteriorum TaxID=3063954 RepID=A0ABT8ZPJ9_9SPHN|nr:LysR substrate-binding domain-containing protein [Sphingobium sp. HBC34]MDO7836373.1 LysR substrate-binding domain-containing protein [Sphingobium sp. HBC34]